MAEGVSARERNSFLSIKRLFWSKHQPHKFSHIRQIAFALMRLRPPNISARGHQPLGLSKRHQRVLRRPYADEGIGLHRSCQQGGGGDDTLSYWLRYQRGRVPSVAKVRASSMRMKYRVHHFVSIEAANPPRVHLTTPSEWCSQDFRNGRNSNGGRSSQIASRGRAGILLEWPHSTWRSSHS